MRTSRYDSAQWGTLFVVTLAITGTLMMHGLEATMVRTHPGDGHVAQTLEASVAGDHADTCSPEIPVAAETKIREDCVVTLWEPTSPTIWRVVPAHDASNRDVLAAFSILIV
jgi:hypothetical protein